MYLLLSGHSANFKHIHCYLTTDQSETDAFSVNWLNALIQFFHHEQDTTQGQFLRGVKLFEFWIFIPLDRLPYRSLIVLSVLLFAHKRKANSWIHTFSRRVYAIVRCKLPRSRKPFTRQHMLPCLKEVKRVGIISQWLRHLSREMPTKPNIF